MKGMEKIVLEIEQRAFGPFLPFLAKPRLELAVWSPWKGPVLSLCGGKLLSGASLQKIEQGETKSPAGKGITIPLGSQSVGSILLFLPEGFACDLKRLLHESYRVLDTGGRIALGFIPRESAWALFYRRKRTFASLNRLPRIYSVKEMEHRVMEAGFSIQGYFCTLFQRPEGTKEMEKPLRGYHFQAGFLVLLGERRTREI